MNKYINERRKLIKMSENILRNQKIELKEPTVSGLIEKLEEAGLVTDNGAYEIRLLLLRETKEMDKTEIGSFISSLDKKIDAPGSNLITGNTINYASFESAIKEEVNRIQTIRHERLGVDKQGDKNGNTLDSNTALNKELTEEEKKQIADNKVFIKNTLNNFFEIPLELDEETEDVLAKSMVELKKYYTLKKELTQKGVSEEEAHKIACKKMQVSEDYFKSSIMGAAKVAVVVEGIERIAQEAKIDSKEEAAKKYLEQNFEIAHDALGDQYEDVHQGNITILKALGLSICSCFEEYSKEKMAEATLEMYKLEATDVDLKSLKKILDRREKADKSRVFWNKFVKKIGNVKDANEEILFEEIKNEYLRTGNSVLDIYNKYMGTKLKKYSFEDVLQGIEGRIRQNDLSVLSEQSLNRMMETERKNRLAYEMREQWEKLDLNRKNPEIIEYEKHKTIYRTEIARIKMQLRKSEEKTVVANGQGEFEAGDNTTSQVMPIDPIKIAKKNGVTNTSTAERLAGIKHVLPSRTVEENAPNIKTTPEGAVQSDSGR